MTRIIIVVACTLVLGACASESPGAGVQIDVWLVADPELGDAELEYGGKPLPWEAHDDERIAQITATFPDLVSWKTADLGAKALVVKRPGSADQRYSFPRQPCPPRASGAEQTREGYEILVSKEGYSIQCHRCWFPDGSAQMCQ
ncbi:MAG: hypothetical protein IT370_09020 [Deltaproteobacteria bacterium]|nr:hypothetical protein [Deltaproteobacteria bacterium]